jgi:hypothetical protein
MVASSPPDTVRAYTAGYVDGEGTIRWADLPILALESCNPNPMRWIAKHYGGKVLTLNRKTATTKRSIYRLVYRGKYCITLILSILEFMIEKKSQAENLLRMWEANTAIQKERRKKH